MGITICHDRGCLALTNPGNGSGEGTGIGAVSTGPANDDTDSSIASNTNMD